MLSEKIPAWGMWGLLGVTLSIVLLSVCFFVVYKRKTVVDRERILFEIPKDKIKKVVLENGMTVLVLERKQVPKVLVQMAYDVGSGVEESGERGLAHLIEHMIFKGTKGPDGQVRLSESDIDAIVKKYGAAANAFTSKDITSYFFEVNKNNWEPFVGILADCMVNARFDQQHLNSEMKAVIQEVRMREDDYIRWGFDKASEVLYPSYHPYHHPTLGYKSDLFELSADRLHKFYKKYYHPSKATLFIVGDVDKDRAIEVAKKHFGTIKAPPTLDDQPVTEIISSIANQTNRIYKDIKKEFCGFYWRIPGLKAGNEVLTSIVSHVLGGAEGSVLYRRLIDKEKVATSVGAPALQLKESGIFFIIVEPKEGQWDRCREIIREELARLASQDLDDEMITKVVRQKERSFLSMLQQSSSLVYEWINSYFATKDEYDLFKRIDKFYVIDSAAIKNYIKTYLDPFLVNELQVLPLPEERKAMWLAHKEKSDKIDAEILKKFERTVPLEKAGMVETMSDPKSLAFSLPKPDKIIMLDNGCKILLHKNDELPLVSGACRLNDATYITKSREGQLVSLMMDMLMEGSVGFSKDDNVDFFELHGARYGFDASGAAVTSVNASFAPVFKRMFHVLTKPRFEKAALEKVKAIFIDAYERSKDSPQSVSTNLFQQMVYKNHPYGWSYDDLIEDVKKLTVSDLEEFHQRYVSPEDMMFVLSGDIDLEKSEKMIREVTRSWPRGNRFTPEIKKGSFTPNEKRNHKMLRDQVILLFGQASNIDMYHEDRVPLRMLSFICFAPGGSRLWDLREQTGLFYAAAGGWALNTTKVHGYDYAFALLSVDKVEQAERQIRELIDNFGKTGATEQELENARQWYLKKVIDLVSTNQSIGSALATLAEYDLGFDYYDKALERVQTITLDELNAICRKYFVTKNFATVRVGRV